jgi:hypothetical protein
VLARARRFSIARARRLQIHLMQNRANRRRTDSGHNPLGDQLACQVLARPRGDVQPVRHRLKTGPLDNLRPLQGGKSAALGQRAASVPPHRSYRFAHTGGTLARPCSDHSATARLPLEPVRLLRSPTRSVHAGLDTRGGFGYVPFAATGAYRPAQFSGACGGGGIFRDSRRDSIVTSVAHRCPFCDNAPGVCAWSANFWN